jgi:hypothetical protein
VDVHSFPAFERLKTSLKETLVAVLVPKVAAQGVAVQGQAKGDHRPRELAFPGSGPLLRRELNPRVNFGHPTISVELGLGVGADGVRLGPFAPWEKRNGINQLRSFNLGGAGCGLREEGRKAVFVAHVVALANNAGLGLLFARNLPVFDPNYLEETSHVDFLLATASLSDDTHVFSDLTLIPASFTIVLGAQLGPLGLRGLERGRVAANLLLVQLFDNHAQRECLGVLFPVALLLRAIHWHGRNTFGREGRVSVIKSGVPKMGKVVHATISIIQRSHDVPRTPRNRRLKVTKVGVASEHVRQNFFCVNILHDTSNNVWPLGAVVSSLAETGGSSVESAPLVHRKALANLSGTEDLCPASAHFLALLLRGGVPSDCVTPIGALSGLLTSRPTPVLFLKIRGGLAVEAKKLGFPDPCVWKLPMIRR